MRLRRRHIVLAGLASLLAACGGGAVIYTHAHSASPSVVASPTGSCPEMRAHVYNEPNSRGVDRLKLLAECKVYSVTGTIELVRVEPDGDDHIRLRLDPGQKDPLGGNWINARNVDAQNGDLVLEPVCENPVTQPDAKGACAGYQNTLVVPPVGTHVKASGYWVVDNSPNHGWNEYHILTALVPI